MSQRLQLAVFYLCVATYTLPLGYGLGSLIGHPVAAEMGAKLVAILGIAVLIRNEDRLEWGPLEEEP